MTGDRAERQASAAITCPVNDKVKNEWHMMHFRSLEMDLCHEFLNGHATLYHTRVRGYLQVVHDAKNVCSELRTQIFNFKMERCPYFLYSQKKLMLLMLIVLPLCAQTVWQSLVSLFSH